MKQQGSMREMTEFYNDIWWQSMMSDKYKKSTDGENAY